MDSIKEIKEYIERNYSEKRKLHTEGVRKTAIELARKYGADEKKAEIAALFHDMYRGMPEKSLNYYVKNLGLDDKDDLRKARADGVVDGVFHQHLTVRADAVDLLISSIARAETRRHDDKGCVHCFSSFSAVGAVMHREYTTFCRALQDGFPEFRQNTDRIPPILRYVRPLLERKCTFFRHFIKR